MGKEKKEAKREQKEKSNRKKCCMAMTSKCLACKEGVSEKKYCKKNPNTNGCSGKGGDGSNKQKWKQVCDDVKQLQAKHPDATKNDVKKYLKKDHSMRRRKRKKRRRPSASRKRRRRNRKKRRRRSASRK